MSDYILAITCLASVVTTILLLRGKPFRPTIADNYTIPPKKALEIATAQFEGRPAIFHGGCNDCIWRNQNTTHAGITFCRGCKYFAFNRDLPDKSITEYDLEKI